MDGIPVGIIGMTSQDGYDVTLLIDYRGRPAAVSSGRGCRQSVRHLLAWPLIVLEVEFGPHKFLQSMLMLP